MFLLRRQFMPYLITLRKNERNVNNSFEHLSKAFICLNFNWTEARFIIDNVIYLQWTRRVDENRIKSRNTSKMIGYCLKVLLVIKKVRRLILYRRKYV